MYRTITMHARPRQTDEHHDIRLKIGPSFYPPSLNSTFYFIAMLRTRRPANGTQPRFATCWTVNRICKCLLKIWGVRPKMGSYNFVTVVISTKLWQMTKNVGRRLYPPSVNARHAYGAFQFGMASRRAALSGNTALISTFSNFFLHYTSRVFHIQRCSLARTVDVGLYSDPRL